MKWFFTFCILVTCSLYASPETYDHLEPYKQLNVQVKGPKKERVIVPHDPNEAYADYSYDSHNRLVKIDYFRNKEFEGSTSFHYGDKGLESEELFNKNSEPLETLTYSYDKTGKLTGYQVTNPAGQQVVRWEFSYIAGSLSKGRRYDGKEITESFHMTSHEGNQVQVIFNPKGEKQGEITFIRDKNVIKERLKEDPTGRRKIIYQYDTAGRLTKMEFYSFDKGKFVLSKEHLLEYN